MSNVSAQIGRRIKEWRQRLNITQKDLAETLKVPRPAISQIENGTRSISADELVLLSEKLQVDVPHLLNPEETEVVLQGEKKKRKKKQQLRVNVPRKNVTRFKEVLLYLLDRVGSKTHIGETVIYKLLYFIDFDYYEKYEEQLIGATYIRNTYGPTPVEFAKVVSRMIDDGDIERVKSVYFQYPQTKYLPRRKPDLSQISGKEIELIDEVLNRLADMNATQISEYSHHDVPWLTTPNGEAIDYDSVFYRTPAYSVRDYAKEL